LVFFFFFTHRKLCPKTFPEEDTVTIAVTGWLLDFMGKYVEGDYDCPHSHARVVNYASMNKEVRICAFAFSAK
jgi:hypothetical protein